jgi:hypothetical protein
MTTFATVLALLAIAGAIASWIAGAVFCARILAPTGRRGAAAWLAVAVWPLAFGRLRDQSPERAADMNKALVAFIACALVAAAAGAAATNLHRISK